MKFVTVITQNKNSKSRRSPYADLKTTQALTFLKRTPLTVSCHPLCHWKQNRSAVIWKSECKSNFLLIISFVLGEIVVPFRNRSSPNLAEVQWPVKPKESSSCWPRKSGLPKKWVKHGKVSRSDFFFLRCCLWGRWKINNRKVRASEPVPLAVIRKHKFGLLDKKQSMGLEVDD